MKLELRRVSLETPGAADARRCWPARPSLLLKLTDDTGASGYGEASPLPGYCTDTIELAEAALSRVVPRELAALSQQPPRSALARAAELVTADAPSARLALESALLDLLGKREGLPAPVLLGAAPDSARTLSQLVGAAAAPESLERAERAVAAGFRQLKLKLGAPGKLEQEVAAVLRLRQRLGTEVELRLDANGALGASEIEFAWPRLQAARIELFEEPGDVPESLLGALPLALDESLQGVGPEALETLVRRRRASWLVLKPTALGGLQRCLLLAERGRELGAGSIVSHCFEGACGHRAAAALALSLPIGVAHGLGPQGVVTPELAGASSAAPAALRVWPQAGLGLSPEGWA